MAAARERLYGDQQGESLLADTGFWADALHLWQTDGADKRLKSWREVARFPLQAPAPAQAPASQD